MVRFARGGYLYASILALLVVFFWFLSFQTTFAQPAGSLVPCMGADECTICHLVQLGQNIINFFVYASVAVATLLFINAGALYVFSPGNPGNISRGHRIFTNTLVGILIILTSWIVVDFVIRSLVDPDLLLPGPDRWGPWNEILCAPSPVGPVAPPPAPAPPVAGAACTPLSPLTDPLAISMEAGNTVIWDNTDPDLRHCAETFAASVGGTITSAYRPAQYQTHLREIFDRWCGQNLRSNTDPACAAVKADVQAHVTQHFGAGWSCGAVGVTSRHTSGTAVDISGIANYSAVAEQARDHCLVWSDYTGDPYHYNLVAGCSCP